MFNRNQKAHIQKELDRVRKDREREKGAGWYRVEQHVQGVRWSMLYMASMGGCVGISGHKLGPS